MTPEQTQKQRFVDRKLAPLLKALGLGIVGADYACVDSCEVVHVEFDNGYRKRINVSCDSLSEIVIDVVKAVR